MRGSSKTGYGTDAAMQDSRLTCILALEIRREETEVIAHCPELRLTDHGRTEQEAESRLRSSIGGFFRICAKNGTLIKVLQDRGILALERQPERYIQVPVPLLAFAQSRTPQH